MKKQFILFLSIISFLYASSTEDIFKNKCLSCHAKAIGIEQSDESIKAPPINMVVMRLKSAFDSKNEFVSFVKDYIQNPSKDKAYCMKAAIERFGLMPAIGQTMSEKEMELIAKWMYDGFSGADFNTNNNNMRCGAAKCGSK